jgi:hypothetical protein
MPSLVLCYAPEDETPARRLGGYLEANLPYQVSYEECVAGPGFDLVDAVEGALSADVALVLMSPRSIPKPLNRNKWEPVFGRKAAGFGTRLGFVLLQECAFPLLIRRSRFFDATSDFEGQSRAVRRWLLRPDQPIQSDRVLNAGANDLRTAVGDRPGAVPDTDHATATAFSAACAEDFEAVHRFDCLGRTRAGILGDLGHALQLKLAGNVEQNREAFQQQCRDRRYLFLMDNVDATDQDFLNFGGLASVIFTSNSPLRERAGRDAINDGFLAVPRDEVVCAGLVGDAVVCVTDLLESDFEPGLRLGWAVVSFLSAAARFAEAVEVLETMGKFARDRDDELALNRIERELSWLREDGDSIRILRTAAPEVEQLPLFT